MDALIKELSKKEIQDKLANLTSKYKLEKKLDSVPMNMSGGERRRLGIAKIIATEPKIIIADEPSIIAQLLPTNHRYNISDIGTMVRRKQQNDLDRCVSGSFCGF